MRAKRTAPNCEWCGGEFTGPFQRRFCSASCARRHALGAPQDRFAAKLVAGPNGCVLHMGSLCGGLYPTFRADGRTFKAHRWAWEQANGPVPDGYQVHHVCEEKRCVNLEHLQLVTPKEHFVIHGAAKNLCGSEPGAAVRRNKTHCPQGHPYSGDNLYVAKGGGRSCKTCARNRWRLKHWGTIER